MSAFSFRVAILLRIVHASFAVALVLGSNAVSRATIYETYGSTDPVVLWNAYTLEASKQVGVAFNTNVTTRILAIQGLAARDAAVAATGGSGLYGGSATIPAGPIDLNIAIANASHKAAYGAATNATYRSFLDTRLNDFLTTIPDSPAKTNGLALGQSVANNILALRAGDNSDLPYTYVDDPSPGPGKWVRTNTSADASTPTWGRVKPFLLNDVYQFPVPAPPELTSPEYAEDYNEVKSLGGVGSALRTAEQSDIANFFRQDAEIPANQVARQLAVSQGLTTSESAELFARLGAGVADARIAIYKVKYDGIDDAGTGALLWRPQQAIWRADEDGNAATEQDAGFTAFIPIPNHPSYIGGNADGAAAGFQILTNYFGTDDVSTLPGVASVAIESLTLAGTRSYTSLSQIAQDSADSRIYGGIHFRFDNEVAQTLGQLVGNFASTVPIPEPATSGLVCIGLAAASLSRGRRRAC